MAIAPAVLLPAQARSAEQTLPAEEWLRVCRFQPFNQSQTLDLLVRHVEKAMQRYNNRGSDPSIKRPVVVIDLDDTSFRSNQTRTWRILREWLAERPDLPWNIRGSLSSIGTEQLAYRIRDSFSEVAGLSFKDPEVAAAFADFEPYWNKRFFSNAYCARDPLHHGAWEFVNKLYTLGANIAYVTGRDEPRMGEGTRQGIINSGLPAPSDRVKLFLKPNKDVDDAEFKKSVCDDLAAWGDVVVTMDNAPANCVVFADAFPKAMNVFVDTVYDKAAVAVRHGLYKIFDFLKWPRST